MSGPLIARLPVAALTVLAVFGALKLVDLSSFRCIWRGWRYRGVLVLGFAVQVVRSGGRRADG